MFTQLHLHLLSTCIGVQLFVVCEVENIHLHWREEEEEEEVVEEERLRINDVAKITYHALEICELVNSREKERSSITALCGESK